MATETHPTGIRVCVPTSVHEAFDGRIFYRQCKTLARAGYEVTVVAPADFEQKEVDGISIRGVQRSSSRWQRPRVWHRLFGQILSLKPDVVHLHDPELLLLVPLLHLALGSSVRIIYDVHEYFIDSLTEKYWIPRPLRPIVASVARWLERALLRGVDGVICVVENQVSLYQDFSGPIAVVRNLPFARLFEDAKPDQAMDVDGFKLLYAGLLLPERGINVLLEAMQSLHSQGREDIHLFLIGPATSPAYIQEIHEFAEAQQLADQIHWLGYVQHDQLKHFLKSAHVGLVPGLRTRQFRNPGISTKLLEYMLCGLPIICVDHPHHLIFLDQCDCGLTVPPTDASAFVDAILYLRNHPDEARAMGQRGRELVQLHYTWERESAQLLAFYDRIL